MRQRANTDSRSNALWGRGSRGESRSNALWGRGGRRAGAITVMVAMLTMASVAVAGPGGGGDSGGKYGNLKAYVAPSLLDAIAQNPKQQFDVIVQGGRKDKASAILQKITSDKSGSSDENVGPGALKRQF